MLKLYAGVPQLKDAAAYLFFDKDSRVQTLVHDFKYHDNSKLAEHLGQLAAHDMKADGMFGDVDFLVPVPLHPKKERQRGYNQSFCIARGFASVYEIPVREDLIRRKLYTLTQTRKSLYERHLNTEEVFAVNDATPFAGKHILLIDDVITTGATSLACIDALMTVPDIRISVFSLSVVP